MKIHMDYGSRSRRREATNSKLRLETSETNTTREIALLVTTKVSVYGAVATVVLCLRRVARGIRGDRGKKHYSDVGNKTSPRCGFMNKTSNKSALSSSPAIS